MKNMSSLVEGKILEFLLTLRTNEGLLYGLESRGCRQRAFVLTKGLLGIYRNLPYGSNDSYLSSLSRCILDGQSKTKQ